MKSHIIGESSKFVMAVGAEIVDAEVAHAAKLNEEKEKVLKCVGKAGKKVDQELAVKKAEEEKRVAREKARLIEERDRKVKEAEEAAKQEEETAALNKKCLEDFEALVE